MMSSPVESCQTQAPVIPGYEILSELGRGGMGVVYLARQNALNRLVCVKVLSELDDEPSEVGRARFVREAELLACLVHPHVLCIFDFGVTADSGHPFLVTEYFEGGDLRRLIAENGPLPLAMARELIMQIGQALQLMHDKGIIHRDLKPENILMATPSLCKVGDFGLAVRQERAGQLTQSVRGLGTAGYVSPEQQYGLKVGSPSDQYSLAALSYELLTGKRPLGCFAPPSVSKAGLPRELDRVILRGMRDEPEERYPSVREFLDELDAALNHEHRQEPLRQRIALAMPAAAVCFLGAALLVAARYAERRWEPAHDQRPGTIRPLATLVPSDNSRPPAPGRETSQPGIVLQGRSAEFIALARYRVSRLLIESGKSASNPDDLRREDIWKEAERQVDSEVNQRAYQFWEEQGSPLGPAGEAVRLTNRIRAETELLKETEEAVRSPSSHADASP